MTDNRTARRFAIVLASGVLASGLAAGASGAAGQDALTRAKDLYASASYDEALAVLDQLQVDASLTDAAEVGEYRAFCLLALGRSDEGRRAIEAIIESNPLFQPSENRASPRLQAVFREVRRQLLPEIVQHSYADAKAAFERNELQAAAMGFDSVLVLLNDPDSNDSPRSADFRTLATGFRDLSKLGMTAMLSTRPVSPSAAAAPEPGPPTEVSAPRRMYGPNDTDVTGPEVVTQMMPPWRPSKSFEVHQGALALVIDENGDVESVALLEGVHPAYNALLLRAARLWKYRPAMKDGVPVRYRKVVGINLRPPN